MLRSASSLLLVALVATSTGVAVRSADLHKHPAEALQPNSHPATHATASMKGAATVAPAPGTPAAKEAAAVHRAALTLSSLDEPSYETHTTWSGHTVHTRSPPGLAKGLDDGETQKDPKYSDPNCVSSNIFNGLVGNLASTEAGSYTASYVVFGVLIFIGVLLLVFGGYYQTTAAGIALGAVLFLGSFLLLTPLIQMDPDVNGCLAPLLVAAAFTVAMLIVMWLIACICHLLRCLLKFLVGFTLGLLTMIVLFIILEQADGGAMLNEENSLELWLYLGATVLVAVLLGVLAIYFMFLVGILLRVATGGFCLAQGVQGIIYASSSGTSGLPFWAFYVLFGGSAAIAGIFQVWQERKAAQEAEELAAMGTQTLLWRKMDVEPEEKEEKEGEEPSTESAEVLEVGEGGSQASEKTTAKRPEDGAEFPAEEDGPDARKNRVWRELKNEALVRRLLEKVHIAILEQKPLDKIELTQEEWDTFKIKDLKLNNFVKSGDTYFQPVGEDEIKAMEEGNEEGGSSGWCCARRKEGETTKEEAAAEADLAEIADEKRWGCGSCFGKSAEPEDGDVEEGEAPAAAPADAPATEAADPAPTAGRGTPP